MTSSPRTPDTTTMQEPDMKPGAPGSDASRNPAEDGEPFDQAATFDETPDLSAQLHEARAEIADLKDAYLRARAETDNVRRQSAAEVGKAHKFAVETFASDLLAVKDSLEQALAVDHATPEQLRAGVELTLRQLTAAFERVRIEEIDPAGRPFDPHRHQAMQVVDSGDPPNTVVQVFQKGYVLNDRVLRPALVTVAKSG